MKCVIGWKFNEYQKNPTFQNKETYYHSYNICRAKEVNNLYWKMKKQKNKGFNKKLLIQGLLNVYHDISQEIEYQQNLPF